MLYVGTFLLALSNGAVEGVTNPVVATLYPKSKTHHLNILHAGWPGGLVLGGLLVIAMTGLNGPNDWRLKIGLFLIPTLVYGVLMLGVKFPINERVAAGVSYLDMLKEFGFAGCLIVSFFAAMALGEILVLFKIDLSMTAKLIIAIVPTIIFAVKVKSFGRPMFVFLLLVMILLATTELGTDSWVAALMTPVLKSLGDNAGNWILIYTSVIMLIMRLCAGPIVHRISPLALLCVCSAIASIGLFWLSKAGPVPVMIFLAATMYGLGKSFFWPTTLGVVSEQFPRGGALTINAMGGMGMIAVGVLGGPLLGTIQDNYLDKHLMEQYPALHEKVAGPEQSKFGFTFQPLDNAKIAALPANEQAEVEQVRVNNNQATLSKQAVLPAIMFFCYLGLLMYFKTKGGYKQVHIEASGKDSREPANQPQSA
jgi:MFS family permease